MDFSAISVCYFALIASRARSRNRFNFSLKLRNENLKSTEPAFGQNIFYENLIYIITKNYKFCVAEKKSKISQLKKKIIRKNFPVTHELEIVLLSITESSPNLLLLKTACANILVWIIEYIRM